MNETTYWITLANLPRWGYRKINELIVRFFHENKLSVVDFFELSEVQWEKDYSLDSQQVSDLITAKKELANNAFLAETLVQQGIDIIPITSDLYSKTMKNNLKMSYSPPLLYTKGNSALLNEESVAIVGSRAAGEVSLQFTDHVAKRAVATDRVVVSGFAKGVDKQALDSSLTYDGKSIIVLPQGIMTFTTGYKKYYKQIIEGKVLVLSTFHPKAVWDKGLAMARNPIIYGLAKEIYVAESSDKGGTWSGVIDGLKKGRQIYVRSPKAGEQNANAILIQKGAIAVDLEGNILDAPIQEKSEMSSNSHILSLDEQIMRLLKQGPKSAKEIIDILQIGGITTQSFTNSLKKKPYISIIKQKNKNLYGFNGVASLF